MQLNELLQQYEKSTGLHNLPTVAEISAMTLDEKKALSEKMAWHLSRNTSTTLKDNFVYQGKYSNMSNATKSELYQAILDLGTNPIPTNNEIWYTTLDNERASLSEVSFKTADEGLIDVTGHYYDGNKWIIKFSDEIGKLYENAIFSDSNLDSCILPDSVISVHPDVFIPLGGFGDVTGNFKIKTSKDEQNRDGRAQISFKLANDTVVSIHCSMI